MEDSKLSYQIIRGAIEVHRALGPGLLESAYQECLQYELSEYGLYVEREKPMPIVYKEVRLNHGYRMDLLVEGRIVVETKTVEALTDVHFAQLLTYLKLGQFRLGLLINFHVTLLKEGISRVLNPELKNSA
ncbi:GxxExxY protein [Larkinella sp. VNQ87]|uniref:GxxExxY protein n=1 Tax=Larkinella sp. VNQ87 TaxID=3400921 RepID=UPI003C108935